MSQRFERAVAAFDAENARDPVQLPEGPEQLVHARRVAAWLERLAPEAPEALRLAARCQHLRRWEIPRRDFPDGRTGYLQWREKLARFHAACAAEILRGVGYDEAAVQRVEQLVRKKHLKDDAEVQLLEDAICCTFLEHEAASFAQKHPEEKVVDILRKTWGKMGPRGRSVVLSALGRGELAAGVVPGASLSVPPPVAALLEQALA